MFRFDTLPEHQYVVAAFTSVPYMLWSVCCIASRLQHLTASPEHRASRTPLKYPELIVRVLRGPPHLRSGSS
jgi:hypothetical protein